ncbi:MAG: SH3 domain-containing protein [Gemmatimonadaceae bacterium]
MRLRSLLFLVPAFVAPVVPARAQTITAPTALYSEPGSHELATLAQGTTLAPIASSGAYVRVTLHGYIATSLLGGKRDSFPATVATAGARVRISASASAAVVAEVKQGMGLHVVRRRGSWTEVERAGWIRRSALPGAPRSDPAVQKPVQKPVQKSAPAAPSDTPPPAAVTPESGDAVTPVTSAPLSAAPGLPAVATVVRGAVLTPTARDRGWVRVKLDGWMRETDLTAADSSLARLSAADLRANPDQYVGRLLRWTVTVLAFQTADPLRHDMSPDEPYLLARGPGDENAMLYLTLPPALVAKAKAYPPLTTVVVTAKVRTGRADPSGVPILDVVSITTK